MKKVNEKLISTLATERLTAADSAAKMRADGSPTSTNSSTSTLKGDESAESIPGLVQEQTSSMTSSFSSFGSRRDNKTDSSIKKEPLVKKDSTDSAIRSGGHSRSFEGPLVITKTYRRDTYLSESDKSPSTDRRSKTPISASMSIDSSKDSRDYLSRSYTIDPRRERGGSTKYTDREPTSPSLNSSTLGRSYARGKNKQSAEELLALDPKTIQSLERLKKLTAHKRPKTPEPLAPAVTDVKLLHSPERRRRRKSEGMHPIEKQAGANFVPVEKTLHEGDECEDEQAKEKPKKEVSVSKVKENKEPVEDKKERSKPTANEVTPAPTTRSVESRKDRKDKATTEKNEVLSSRRVNSPAKDAVSSKRATSPVNPSAKNEAVSTKRVTSPVITVAKNEVVESPRVTSPVKSSSRSASPNKMNRLSESERKTTSTAGSSKWTSSRVENENRSPSPKKRIPSSSSSEDTSVKPAVSISSFTRVTPVDRMWSDIKKEDSNGTKIRTSPRSSRYQDSSNSSPSLVDDSNRSPSRRYYVTRERYAGSIKIKSLSAQESAEVSPMTSRSTSPTKSWSKEETKTSSEVEKKSPPPSKEATPTRTRSPPVNGDRNKTSAVTKEVSQSVDTPGIIVRAPSISESKGQSSSPTNQSSDNNKRSENHLSSDRDFRVRQKSPVSDRIKVIKANRRKTPVISEDALAAILRGEIPEDDLVDEKGMCPISPLGNHHTTLETCPEEDEGPTNKQSPSRKNILKASSFEQTPTDMRTPEKKVTISSEPCIRRVGKKPMLSAEMRERTKSLTMFSPERSLSPTSPVDFTTIPEEEGGNLRQSSNRLAPPVSRLRVSSMVMSRSTPDLSEILGPKKKDRKARRIERSNSKRRVRVDSYVTSTTPNSMYNPLQSSGSFSAPRSSRRLSGSRFSKFAAAFSRKDKDNSEKDTNNRQSEKSSKRW